jgi:hypothetical protein
MPPLLAEAFQKRRMPRWRAAPTPAKRHGRQPSILEGLLSTPIFHASGHGTISAEELHSLLILQVKIDAILITVWNTFGVACDQAMGKNRWCGLLGPGSKIVYQMA